MKKILVFSTDLSSPSQVGTVHQVLSEVAGIKKWTVDLQDSDRVLRVVSWTVSAQHIERLLQSLGFRCLQMT
ncbi:hypothetical protein [Arcticibacter sp. MXS-1]|uniref:hypothetical protein n=1 Tax=Arcticibacter sp. MXS-1 TaxID=3341726 RepID=UPI0035A8245C